MIVNMRGSEHGVEVGVNVGQVAGQIPNFQMPNAKEITISQEIPSSRRVPLGFAP
jgi:hypothetical protein